ncbi:MAG: CTP synthase [Candidatus Eisenbacteria bacterium]|uniref:CTP synthase n=1 Tax=Eiseniibacteriota bacterium TaxID=2212470 RepID=A0A956LZE7_UNCEI|nr:CTP synthase [Candidatus Eisenbacteria bacterium]
MQKEPRFVFVTGGVVSSLGKGIAAASLGLLLKERGLRVTLQKFDPYLNVDPGTMSPYQHGEVFVTDDGAETDLDLGHYERFTDVALGRANSVSAGQIYDTIITRERKGDYLGKTVQVIPHVTDEIKRRMVDNAIASGADVAIIEIGGTVGDIESLPFLEAIRQLRLEMGRTRTFFAHVTLVPYVRAAQELKTKPTQHSVKGLREIGIQPDVLLCRTEVPIPADVRQKMALFCNVPANAVIEAPDVRSIYEVPTVLHRGGLDDLVLEMLALSPPDLDLVRWETTVRSIVDAPDRVRIAVCGKYTHLRDAYKSIIEAMVHAGAANGVQVEVHWVESSQVEDGDPERILERDDAVLVPGGFGERGIEGMVRMVRFARETRLPFLGICLGMHCASIEIARDLCGYATANSTEFDQETPHPIIDLMPDQVGKTKGGTMRLGAYPCDLAPESLAHEVYGETPISERHRHRFEFNNLYRAAFEKVGVRFSGVCPQNGLVEILELPSHPWFIGVQFHPELKSRPQRAHPLFRSFVAAAVAHRAPKGSHAHA